MGMQNIETSTPGISQNLKRPEDVRTWNHAEILDRKTKPLCSASWLFIDPFLTDAGYNGLKSQFGLLGHQVQEHYLGTVKAATVDYVQNFQFG